MDFYLDFEATQFGEKVIAIGAVCGDYRFKTLCQPCGKSKITPFITQLTGITKQDVANAATVETAFACLYRWITACSREYPGPQFFHVFGNCDKNFILSTAKFISDPEIKKFMFNLAYALIDDAQFVTKYFHVQSIGVYNALRYFKPDTPEQDHCPMHDAEALRDLMECIVAAPPLTEPVLEIHIQKENPKPYCITVKSIDPNATRVRVFSSYRDAFNWGYNLIDNNTRGTKPQKANVEKRILKAIREHKPYANYTWIKEEIK